MSSCSGVKSAFVLATERPGNKWLFWDGKTDVGDMLLPPLSKQTLQTNEAFAATCKKDNDFSVTVQSSRTKLRLLVFWVTFRRCWAMHSETFHPPVCPHYLYFSSRSSPNQTHWKMPVTNAPEDFSCDSLSTEDSGKFFQRAQLDSAWFVCTASNLLDTSVVTMYCLYCHKRHFF